MHVLLAIHQSISVQELSSPQHLEVVSVRLNSPLSLVLCAVYLPTHSCSTHCLDLCNYLSNLSGNNKVIILGDFNFPCIN